MDNNHYRPFMLNVFKHLYNFCHAELVSASLRQNPTFVMLTKEASLREDSIAVHQSFKIGCFHSNLVLTQRFLVPRNDKVVGSLFFTQFISLPAKFVMLTKGSISAWESNYDLFILLIAFLCKSGTNAEIPCTSEWQSGGFPFFLLNLFHYQPNLSCWRMKHLCVRIQLPFINRLK